MSREYFHVVFQVTKSIVFEVSYYRLGRNERADFTTEAMEFNKPKTDYCCCGQCQDHLLPKQSAAMWFYKKWDRLHLHDLSDEEYEAIKIDLLRLEAIYNSIRKSCDSTEKEELRDFRFREIKELSKLPVKKPPIDAKAFAQKKEDLLNWLIDKYCEEEGIPSVIRDLIEDGDFTVHELVSMGFEYGDIYES